MSKTKKLVLSALFLALGLIMPFLTGQIPEIGNQLLPMHIPVLLCGFICGGPYGLLVGFLTPLFRSVLFGMPPMLPIAVSMAFELATYGLAAGVLYQKLKNKKAGIYISLIGAMLAGRVVWGMVSMVLYGILGNVFTGQIFAAGAFINAVPGILIQLVLIPAIVFTLKKARLIEV